MRMSPSQESLLHELPDLRQFARALTNDAEAADTLVVEAVRQSRRTAMPLSRFAPRHKRVLTQLCRRYLKDNPLTAGRTAGNSRALARLPMAATLEGSPSSETQREDGATPPSTAALSDSFLQSLSANQRVVLLLAMMEQLSIPLIAALLGQRRFHVEAILQDAFEQFDAFQMCREA